MAEGHSELTPARRLGLRGRCVCPWAPFIARGFSAVGAARSQPGSSRGWWMWGAETLRRLPGEGETGPFQNPENCNCPSLSVQGRGRMLPLEVLNGAP